MEEETKEINKQDGSRAKLHLVNQNDDSDDGDDEEDFQSIAFPAISPVSNISTSSGFISCGSSSSSKPTTPIPSQSSQINDKYTVDDEFNCSEEKIFEASIDGREIISTSDNESGGEHNKHNVKKSSSSKGAKSRSKHRNLSRASGSETLFVYSRINSENQGRSVAATICRHKSEENPSTPQPSNQIVSILKRKDSTCTGVSSPSLVTFSPNVKDIEAPSSAVRSTPHNRRGILKKRSSLDESSRRYRSHSPSTAPSSGESEKGYMRKNYHRRRNSCEEIHNQHGILKQKSYESTGYSSSSGVNTPNSTTSVQGILKKPSLTPSDHSSEHSIKHVSISEAVILAAAELYKDMIIDDSQEPIIKPILKLECENIQSHEIRPKPILKKNHSAENEEIRSILKSRKSSRDEGD